VITTAASTEFPATVRFSARIVSGDSVIIDVAIA